MLDRTLLGIIVTIFGLLVVGLVKEAYETARQRREARRLLGMDRANRNEVNHG